MFRTFNSSAGRLSLLLFGAVVAAAVALGIVGCGSFEPPVPVDVRLDLDNMGDDELCERLDEAIEYTFRHRRLNTQVNAAWQIIHAVIPFGRNLLIEDPQGNVVRAMDYVFEGGVMQGWNLQPGVLLSDGRTGIVSLLEPGTTTGQGHKDQWLGYVSVASVTHSRAPLLPTAKVMVRGKECAIADWIEQIKYDIHDGTERGWSLMALSQQVKSTDSWTAGDGQSWSLDRIMAVEAAKDFREESCGGTHALGGMTIALLAYLGETGARIADDGPHQGKLVDRNGEPITGGYADANDRIQQAIRLAREYQLPDGSFSTLYFQGSEYNREMEDRFRKTGHTLEFLCLALSKKELAAPWIRRAVINLLDVLDRTAETPLECGSLYHGLSGLVLYRKRMFDESHGPLDFDRWAEEVIAANAKNKKSLSKP
ncbi:MAG: hypothetical protein WD875_05685 [Pirellulales bacterium]